MVRRKKPVFSNENFHYCLPIYEMTINPKPGNAVKEFYFTKKDDKLYAISPQWPQGDKIFIKEVKIGEKSSASLLGCNKKLPMEIKKGVLEIDISSIGINDLVCSYLYTFRITGVEQK